MFTHWTAVWKQHPVSSPAGFDPQNGGGVRLARSMFSNQGQILPSPKVVALGQFTQLHAIERNGYIESFNGKLRDELLNREIFDTLGEAKVLVERWRREYNQIRPHSALAYRPPAPEAKLPRSQELDSIPWDGLQITPALTSRVVPLVGADHASSWFNP